MRSVERGAECKIKRDSFRLIRSFDRRRAAFRGCSAIRKVPGGGAWEAVLFPLARGPSPSSLGGGPGAVSTRIHRTQVHARQTYLARRALRDSHFRNQTNPTPSQATTAAANERLGKHRNLRVTPGAIDSQTHNSFRTGPEPALSHSASARMTREVRGGPKAG